MTQLQRRQEADTSKFLSTKLMPPRLRSTRVPREPLLARLDKGLEHKINTVKTQVKSIYRKLDVHSRRAARDAAHRLKLL